MFERPIDNPSVNVTPSNTLGAALTYFVLVFATGFVLGAVRVPFLEPRFGKLIATLIEAPIMIVAIIIAACHVTAWFALAGRRLELSFVGILAVSLAAVADLCVGLLLRQMSFGEQLLYLMTPAGLTYLLLLAIFAATPLLGDLWRQRASRADSAPHAGIIEPDQAKEPTTWQT